VILLYSLKPTPGSHQHPWPREVKHPVDLVVLFWAWVTICTVIITIHWWLGEHYYGKKGMQQKPCVLGHTTTAMRFIFTLLAFPKARHFYIQVLGYSSEWGEIYRSLNMLVLCAETCPTSRGCPTSPVNTLMYMWKQNMSCQPAHAITPPDVSTL